MVSNQGSVANYKASDIQVGKISGSAFTMTHQMGLAEIQLTTGTYTSITGANNSTTTITNSSSNISVTASSSFNSASPYSIPLQKGSTVYYYAIVETGSASTQFNSNSGTDQWTSAITATDISSGNCSHYNAQSIRVGSSIYSGAFSYSGSYLTFNVPFSGTFTVECWGAQGCAAFVGRTEKEITQGGYGAYCYGDISCQASDKLYIYIGQQGASIQNTAAWNGGGASYNGTYPDSQTRGGGGATDIRLTSGAWNNAASLRSRIMVAGAGGGATDYYDGAHACGLRDSIDTFASQTKGGNLGYGSAGGFGYGGTGQFGPGSGHYGGAGGGSGWYGGSGGLGNNWGHGGTSYISGHAGCVAIASASSNSASTAGTENSVARSAHYSGKIFTSTKMIDGEAYTWTTERTTQSAMPRPSGGSYPSGTGHTGNGYCKISGTTLR